MFAAIVLLNAVKFVLVTLEANGPGLAKLTNVLVLPLLLLDYPMLSLRNRHTTQ